MTAGFLSINDLRARWSCSRAFAYQALGEMESGGYLQRLYIGRDQRVAIGSVEEYERRHAVAPDVPRAQLAAARGAATQARRMAPRASIPATGLREQWRRMRGAA